MSVIWTIALDIQITTSVITTVNVKLESSNLIALGLSCGYFVLIDLLSKDLPEIIDNGSSSICKLKFIKSGLLSLLIVCSRDNEVKVYDIDAWEVIFNLKGHKSPVNIIESICDG